MGIVKIILKFCRAAFLPVTVLPLFAGFAFALKDDIMAEHDLLNFMVLVFTSSLIHLFANGINDYFDFNTGLEGLIKHELRQKPNDAQGGSKMLTDGTISPEKARKILLAMLMAIILLGSYVILFIDIGFLLFGTTGIALGYFYTAPPFKLSYRGLGEPVIFICFGLLPFYSGYYYIKREICMGPLLPASIYGLLTVLILYFHHFGHWKQDEKAGKKNIIVILGVRWGIRLYMVLLLLIAGLIILNVYYGNFDAFALALIMPPVVLLHKLNSLDFNNYDEVQGHLKDIIMTNFILSFLIILSMVL